ncbi:MULTISPECIES: SDR family NAD(P)-dependent oxidoreductase [unclassified Salipiger]|uniref:SDR family NAD(P)-dependent oxidoreductase n=1 Tax=unclassified Salipiger TaxID=2640570 RepID=UPI0013B6015C|nr:MULTISPECIES: SDR family oxidoreductase [unclassified Salipiger]NDV52302.1 SDR family oxidoreductase [Salipiger sp. PrR003]NDW34166.1 SDR family oxidoreductase [Salipiger sp. PrR007]
MQLPATPSFSLRGKRALVTGATSGIGLGAATALARAGAHVICVARRAGPLAEVVEAMEREGLSCEALPLDITDVDTTRETLDTIDAVEIVVNSAGMARHGPALDTTPEDFDAVMHVNLRAAYFLSTAAARRMIDSGTRGSIVHVSSQMGHVGGIDRGVYCASKHALEGMVKSMAIEWGPHGVRINTLCPTFIRTPLGEQTLADPARRAWIEDKIKLGRVGEVEDIMGAVVYLCSEASSLVTGTSLLVDGGWTAD